MVKLVCVGQQTAQLTDIVPGEDLAVRANLLFTFVNEWTEQLSWREVLGTGNPHERFQDRA